MQTAQVARAAFPKGNPYLSLRDSFGSIFTDEDFADLFPRRGQPAYPPWRLALVTILQFRENLPDRQAVEAVRARIDWKYLLGLELTDPGFDDSVLSEFRARLLEGGAESRLLDKLLVRLQETGLLKERGRQRSDSTHVLAAVRELNRLEHVAETLRAALNAIAQVAPSWLRDLAPQEWFERYGRRIEDSRLPKGKDNREAYYLQVGTDGFLLIDASKKKKAPPQVASLKEMAYLEHVWHWHFARGKPPGKPKSKKWTLRAREKHEEGPAGERPNSPYDHDARYGNKGGDPWIGYRAHFTETCDDSCPRFITHSIGKVASFHDSYGAPLIHEALSLKQLLPSEHLVDTGYITAKAMLDSQKRFSVDRIGATMYNTSWQKRETAAFGTDQFVIDWEKKQIRCPEGKLSEAWGEYETEKMGKFVRARFKARECQRCSVKTQCVRSETRGRQLTLRREEAFQVLEQMRQETKSEKENYKRRAGIEGTISQAVRGFGLRKTRYRSPAKTHLQTIATAAAINIDRFFAWQQGVPLAKTRTLHFAALTLIN